MDRYLGLLPYLLIMLAVPLVLGAAVHGSWRGGWAYFKGWCKCIAVIAALGLVLVIIMLPF
jgi:hypothetical protein